MLLKYKIEEQIMLKSSWLKTDQRHWLNLNALSTFYFSHMFQEIAK